MFLNEFKFQWTKREPESLRCTCELFGLITPFSATFCFYISFSNEKAGKIEQQLTNIYIHVCMYVYVCVYTHTHIHTHTHTYTHYSYSTLDKFHNVPKHQNTEGMIQSSRNIQ